MAFSIIHGIYDGSGDPVPVNFTNGFLSRDHVTCRVNEEVDGLGDPVYRPLTWITDGLVQIGGAPLVNGDEYVLVRTTPRNELIHDYADGSPVTEENLDESNLQALMLAQEILDGRFVEGFQQELNMNSRKIINLADGEDPNDAVNRAQLEDFTGNAPFYAAQAAASADAAADTLSDTEDVYDATVILHGEVQAGLDELNGRFDDLPLNNYSAIAAPTVTDDSSAGYAVGSKWYDTVGKEAYACLDATEGAAIWETSTLTIDELGALAVQDQVSLGFLSTDLRQAVAHKGITGLTISNNGTSPDTVLDFGAGHCWSSDQTTSLIVPSGGSIDITDSADGNDGGSIGANDSVYIFVVGDTTGVNPTTVKWSDTLSPAFTGYNKYRYIRSRTTDGSGHLRPATDYGDRTELDEPFETYNASVTSTPVLASAGVPVGDAFLAHLAVRGERAAGSVVFCVYTPGKTVAANNSFGFTAGGATNAAWSGYADCVTNSSGQVEVVSAVGTTTINLDINGWTDFRRGEFA